MLLNHSSESGLVNLLLTFKDWKVIAFRDISSAAGVFCSRGAHRPMTLIIYHTTPKFQLLQACESLHFTLAKHVNTQHPTTTNQSPHIIYHVFQRR